MSFISKGLGRMMKTLSSEDNVGTKTLPPPRRPSKSMDINIQIQPPSNTNPSYTLRSRKISKQKIKEVRKGIDQTSRKSFWLSIIEKDDDKIEILKSPTSAISSSYMVRKLTGGKQILLDSFMHSKSKTKEDKGTRNRQESTESFNKLSIHDRTDSVKSISATDRIDSLKVNPNEVVNPMLTAAKRSSVASIASRNSNSSMEGGELMMFKVRNTSIDNINQTTERTASKLLRRNPSTDEDSDDDRIGSGNLLLVTDDAALGLDDYKEEEEYRRKRRGTEGEERGRRSPSPSFSPLSKDWGDAEENNKVGYVVEKMNISENDEKIAEENVKAILMEVETEIKLPLSKVKSEEGRRELMYVLDEFIHNTNRLKEVNRVFAALQILPSSLCMPWVESLFLNTLSTPILLRVIDCLLVEGKYTLLRVVFTILSYLAFSIDKDKPNIRNLVELQAYSCSILLNVDPSIFLSKMFEVKYFFGDEWDSLLNERSWSRNILCSLSQSAPSLALVDSTSSYSTYEDREREYERDEKAYIDIEEALWFGFDLDHTLSPYNIDNLDSLLFTASVKRLIQLNQCFLNENDMFAHSMNASFHCRGVYIDLEKGNVVQLNHMKEIVKCYHGNKLLSLCQVRLEYGGVVLGEEELDKDRYLLIHIQGARPLVSLIILVIERSENRKKEKLEKTKEKEEMMNRKGVEAGFINKDREDAKGEKGSKEREREKENAIDYKDLCNKVKDAFNFTQTTSCKGGYVDMLKDKKVNYLYQQKYMKQFLSLCKKKNKRVFLVTNSDFEHTDNLCSFCFGHDWVKLFDIVICSAKKKEKFFTSTTMEFQKLDAEGKAHGGSVLNLELNCVYKGGNASALSAFFLRISKEDHSSGINIFNSSSPLPFPDTQSLFNKHVLYFGDHYGDDILNSHSFGWKAIWIAPEILSINTNNANDALSGGDAFLSPFNSTNNEYKSFLFHQASNYALAIIPSTEWLAKMVLNSKDWKLTFKSVLNGDGSPYQSFTLRKGLSTIRRGKTSINKMSDLSGDDNRNNSSFFSKNAKTSSPPSSTSEDSSRTASLDFGKSKSILDYHHRKTSSQSFLSNSSSSMVISSTIEENESESGHASSPPSSNFEPHLATLTESRKSSNLSNGCLSPMSDSNFEAFPSSLLSATSYDDIGALEGEETKEDEL